MRVLEWAFLNDSSACAVAVQDRVADQLEAMMVLSAYSVSPPGVVHVQDRSVHVMHFLYSECWPRVVPGTGSTSHSGGEEDLAGGQHVVE